MKIVDRQILKIDKLNLRNLEVLMHVGMILYTKSLPAVAGVGVGGF